jgi:hypothetical protein
MYHSGGEFFASRRVFPDLYERLTVLSRIRYFFDNNRFVPNPNESVADFIISIDIDE